MMEQNDSVLHSGPGGIDACYFFPGTEDPGLSTSGATMMPNHEHSMGDDAQPDSTSGNDTNDRLSKKKMQNRIAQRTYRTSIHQLNTHHGNTSQYTANDTIRMTSPLQPRINQESLEQGRGSSNVLNICSSRSRISKLRLKDTKSPGTMLSARAPVLLRPWLRRSPLQPAMICM